MHLRPGIHPEADGGVYSAPPDSFAGGNGGRCPLLKNPSPFSAFGLEFWPFGPQECTARQIPDYATVQRCAYHSVSLMLNWPWPLTIGPYVMAWDRYTALRTVFTVDRRWNAVSSCPKDGNIINSRLTDSERRVVYDHCTPRRIDRHVQHVRPNRGPTKGAPQAREYQTAAQHLLACGDLFMAVSTLKSSLGAA